MFDSCFVPVLIPTILGNNPRCRLHSIFVFFQNRLENERIALVENVRDFAWSFRKFRTHDFKSFGVDLDGVGQGRGRFFRFIAFDVFKLRSPRVLVGKTLIAAYELLPQRFGLGACFGMLPTVSGVPASRQAFDKLRAGRLRRSWGR